MELWNDWHFIDKPYVEDGTFPTLNYTALTLNAINLVKTSVSVLSTNVNKTTAERALFARYLVHVIGDIHQPLHSVSLFNATFPKGDRGGNDIKVTLPNGTANFNLHAFWDAGAMMIQNDTWFLVRPLDQNNATVLKNRALDLIKQHGD